MLPPLPWSMELCVFMHFSFPLGWPRHFFSSVSFCFLFFLYPDPSLSLYSSLSITNVRTLAILILNSVIRDHLGLLSFAHTQVSKAPCSPLLASSQCSYNNILHSGLNSTVGNQRTKWTIRALSAAQHKGTLPGPGDHRSNCNTHYLRTKSRFLKPISYACLAPPTKQRQPLS